MSETPVAGRALLVAGLFGLAVGVLVPLLSARRLPWRTLGMIPAVYVALAVPAWIAGRPFGELMAVYVHQTGEYSGLTLNAPSIYSFLQSAAHVDAVRRIGVLLAATAFLMLFWVMVRRKLTMDAERIVLLAAVSVMLAPFLLPAMHERYFYLADVLTVVAAFWSPRRLWFVPLLVQCSSALTYRRFLFPPAPGVDLRLLTVAIGVALVAAVGALLRREHSRSLGT